MLFGGGEEGTGVSTPTHVSPSAPPHSTMNVCLIILHRMVTNIYCCWYPPPLLVVRRRHL